MGPYFKSGYKEMDNEQLCPRTGIVDAEILELE
jgi:hypothetical protein